MSIPDRPDLSERELDILKLMALGLTNQEIAQRLYVSPETVKWYAKQIYPKLDADNRTQATRNAQALGLLGEPASMSGTSTSARRSNLPSLLTSFIGREQALKNLEDTLQVSRLVTVTGPGGIGKTRLLIQLARRLLDRFTDGVWLVELARLDRAEDVLPAIANSLDIVTHREEPVEASVTAALRDKTLLLLLDNFEHLLESADQVGALINAAPNIVVIASSRERLNLYGETEFRLGPLGEDSADLFLDRARFLRLNLPDDEETQAEIRDICRLLDELPLAIELAVPLLRLFSPALLKSQLQADLRHLPPGPRNLPERQQTLRSTFEWSYRLLGEKERFVLVALSVFKNGATLGAMQHVCGMEEVAVLEHLYNLVNRNLVISREGRDGEIYFDMLETTKVFAEEMRSGNPSDKELIRRHAVYYVDLAEKAHKEYISPRHVYWFKRIQIEHENFRAAGRYWSAVGKPENSLLIPTRLSIFLRELGKNREVRKWIESTWPLRDQIPERIYADSLLVTAELSFGTRSHENTEKNIGEAREIYDRLGDAAGLAWCTTQESIAHLDRGDLQQSKQAAQSAVDRFQVLQDIYGLIFAHNLLGEVYRSAADYASAETHYRISLDMAHKHGVLCRELNATSNLAAILNHREDFTNAEKLARSVVRFCIELDIIYGIAYEIGLLAGPTLGMGNSIRAARLLGAANAHLAPFDIPQPLDYADLHEIFRQAGDLLGDNEFRLAWEEGQRMTIREAAAYALNDGE